MALHPEDLNLWPHYSLDRTFRGTGCVRVKKTPTYAEHWTAVFHPTVGLWLVLEFIHKHVLLYTNRVSYEPEVTYILGIGKFRTLVLERYNRTSSSFQIRLVSAGCVPNGEQWAARMDLAFTLPTCQWNSCVVWPSEAATGAAIKCRSCTNNLLVEWRKLQKSLIHWKQIFVAVPFSFFILCEVLCVFFLSLFPLHSTVSFHFNSLFLSHDHYL